MRKILQLILLSILMQNSDALIAQDQKYYDVNLFDGNNILIPLNNMGGVDPFYKKLPNTSFWDHNNYKGTIIYDQGLWLLGKIDEDPFWAFSRWRSSYAPGPIIDGKAARLETREDSLKYRVYKINKYDTIESNKDVAEWPIELGAPADAKGNPIVYGDQTVFTVYNAGDSNNYILNRLQERGDTLMRPLPFEVRQLAYGYNRFSGINLLNNIMFIEWEIINKGDQQIDSTYIGLWSDIDFFETSDNIPAYDIPNEIGYCWSGVDEMGWNPNNNKMPPSIGYSLLYGPIVKQNNSSGYYKGEFADGIKNLPVNSFHAISDDASWDGNPNSVLQAWNIARALDMNGNTIIDDSTGLATKFPYSGDPITDSGWVYKGPVGGGSGFVMFSGPFDFAPGDTQWVMAALIPSIGEDRFDSIRELRLNAKTLRSIPYDQLVDKTVIKIYDDSLPTFFSLSQNYPNPFNNSTEMTYTIPDDKVFNDVPVVLKIYDLLGQEIATLVNENQNPGVHSVEWNASELASGVYFYRLEVSNYAKIKKMILLK